MLNNDDLKKIKGVVHDAIHEETPGIVEEIVEKKLKPVNKDLRKIKKDITTIIDYFDRGQMKLEKRVDRIENHLSLPPLPPITFVSPNI